MSFTTPLPDTTAHWPLPPWVAGSAARLTETESQTPRSRQSGIDGSASAANTASTVTDINTKRGRRNGKCFNPGRERLLIDIGQIEEPSYAALPLAFGTGGIGP